MTDIKDIQEEPLKMPRNSAQNQRQVELLNRYVGISIEFWTQKFNETFKKLHNESSLSSPCHTKSEKRGFSASQIAPNAFRKELGVLNSISLEPKKRLDNLGGFSEQNKSVKRPKWGSTDDQTLMKLAFRLDEDWSKIAQHFSRFKVLPQILKERHDKLKNQVLPEKRRFTDDEDVQILKYYRKLGPKWKLIASKLYRRTSASVKSRFYSNLRYRIKEDLHIEKSHSHTPLDTESVTLTAHTHHHSEAQPEIGATMPSENWDDSFIDIDHFLFSEKKNESAMKHHQRLQEEEEEIYLDGDSNSRHQSEDLEDDQCCGSRKKLKSEASRFEYSEDFSALELPSFDKQLDFSHCSEAQYFSSPMTHDEDIIGDFLLCDSELPEFEGFQPAEEKAQIEEINQVSQFSQESQKDSKDVIKNLHSQVSTLVSSLQGVYDQIQNEIEKLKANKK